MPAVKVLLGVTFVCEMYTTVILSLIAFYGKQMYHYGSSRNPRACQFLYRMRYVTIFALALYTLGLFAFVIGFLLEATKGLALWIILAVTVAPTATAFVSWQYADVCLRAQGVGRGLSFFAHSVEKKYPDLVRFRDIYLPEVPPTLCGILYKW